MKISLLPLFLVFMLTIPVFSQTFRNPVIPGFNPDPSICRVEKDYYLATSSFHYWPGIPIYHSKDLVNWELISYAITRSSQCNLSSSSESAGLWAPTLRHHKGRFYMIVSKINLDPWKSETFFVHADHPSGPWSEPVYVAEAKGIDPDLFFDVDGRCYFSCNDSKGIVAAEIDLTTGNLLTPFHHLWSGTGGPYAEAPHIYRKDGQYYLLIAEGGTGPYHRCTIARSDDVLGNYQPYDHNPILNHTMRWMHPIQCTGHGDLVEAHDGSWWLVFLAKRSTGFEVFNSVLGRETFLSPVSWNQDGWPVVGNRGDVEIVMNGPGFYTGKQDQMSFRDDFDKPEADLKWNYIRNPDLTKYERNGNGYLTLWGKHFNLNDKASPVFTGIRLQHFNCSISTSVVFEPVSGNEEAGLAVFAGENNYYSISVGLKNNKKVVTVKGRIGKMSAELINIPAGKGETNLKIISDPESITFLCSNGEDTYKELYSLEAKYIQSPQFTGAYVGIYSTGNGKDCKNPARFAWFEYSPENIP